MTTHDSIWYLPRHGVDTGMSVLVTNSKEEAEISLKSIFLSFYKPLKSQLIKHKHIIQ